MLPVSARMLLIFKQPSTVKLITNVFYSALPLKLGKCASYEEFGTPHLLEKGPILKKRLIMVTLKWPIIREGSCKLHFVF